MKTETQLEEMFGGGPELPPTHWMERYATASARAENLAAEITTLASENKRLREALASVIGLASSYVESQCMRACEPTIEAARAALARKGGGQ